MKFNKSVVPNKGVQEGKTFKKNKSATLVYGTLEQEESKYIFALEFRKQAHFDLPNNKNLYCRHIKKNTVVKYRLFIIL